MVSPTTSETRRHQTVARGFRKGQDTRGIWRPTGSVIDVLSLVFALAFGREVGGHRVGARVRSPGRKTIQGRPALKRGHRDRASVGRSGDAAETDVLSLGRLSLSRLGFADRVGSPFQGSEDFFFSPLPRALPLTEAGGAGNPWVQQGQGIWRQIRRWRADSCPVPGGDLPNLLHRHRFPLGSGIRSPVHWAPCGLRPIDEQ